MQIPYLAISSLIFASIAFTMAGIATNAANAFFLFWFIFFLYASCITFFGLTMAVLTPNAEVSMATFELLLLLPM